MCSIPPVVFLIIEFRAASLRHDRSRIALVWRSQPSVLESAVLDGKRLQRRFVKSRAPHHAARLRGWPRRKKSFVRQKICADEAGCLSRGREKRRRRGLQAGSRRPCAVIQRPGLREPMAPHKRSEEATASPRLSLSRLRPLAGSGGTSERSGAVNVRRSCLATLLRRPWLSPRGSRSRPSVPATGSHRARGQAP